MTTRTRTERDEWTLAGELASGIPRARVALALAGAKANHERAEGIR
ncbi:hypothetical protein [Haloplanus halophilus]|nr:hypothetical protein [Haloplanus sp. GDY1]